MTLNRTLTPYLAAAVLVAAGLACRKPAPAPQPEAPKARSPRPRRPGPDPDGRKRRPAQG